MSRRSKAGRAHWISVEGARTHNLKDVSVLIPKHSMTVFTGVSGSGKSSLVFDTIAAEAERLVSTAFPVFVRSRLPQHPPADVDRVDGLTFTTTIDQRRFGGGARSTLATASDIAPLMRMLFSRLGRPSAGFSPAYSFNDPSGMCPVCEGLGVVDDLDLTELIDPTRSLNDGAVRFPAFLPGTYRWRRLVLSGLADPDVPWGELPASVRETFLHAEGLRLSTPEPGYPEHRRFDGIVPRLREGYLRRTPSRLTQAEREAVSRMVTRRDCPECAGTRLNAAARNSLIAGRSIADWAAMPVRDLRAVVAAVDAPGVAPLLTAISERLESLVEVGLGYLSLDRDAPSLSGGEAQRVKLVRQLGSALSDATYVLDEPSAGLHPHDVSRLMSLLRRLRDAHNTVLVVEHNPQVIAAADHVIDLGPGAGTAGGRVLFTGRPVDLAHAATPTGSSLRTRLQPKSSPRTSSASVRVSHASLHNLRGVTVDVPLGVLTVATGVAGSGKSTLFTEVLPAQHPEFVAIGQRPLRGITRANAATALDVAERIRHHFAEATGLSPSWFSANGRGACPACRGRGSIATDLAFMEDVHVPCEACSSTGFSPRTLGATLDGLSIADVLASRPEQAAAVFSSDPKVAEPLAWMHRVGLGYVSLGQSLDTLSGGELQRLSLAKVLSRGAPPDRLRIILDEPAAGLHPMDVDHMLDLLEELVDEGATVLVAEHNQRVIVRADHVIDLGPGAGTEGGAVVYAGTVAGLLAHPASLTGRYLRAAIS